MNKLFTGLALFWSLGANDPVAGQNLRDLEAARRYDLIVNVSLYHASLDTCGVECRVSNGLNAMRASILLGDSDAAILIGQQLLREANESANSGNFTAQALHLATYATAINGDTDSARSYLKELAPPDRSRMYRLIGLDAPFVLDELDKSQVHVDSDDSTMTQPERDAWGSYYKIPKKSPWVAGIANLVVPGAGYAYLGMWQTSFLSTLLTGICVFSAHELIQNELYASGIAVGLVGSVFYIGGALGAARSANDINNRNTKAVSDRLRHILLPELRIQF